MYIHDTSSQAVSIHFPRHRKLQSKRALTTPHPVYRRLCQNIHAHRDGAEVDKVQQHLLDVVYL